MVLTIQTYKVRKADDCPVYKAYRYACFDTACDYEGMEFREKFNNAFNVLREEIDQDRNNNDITQYEPIIICNVLLS